MAKSLLDHDENKMSEMKVYKCNLALYYKLSLPSSPRHFDNISFSYLFGRISHWIGSHLYSIKRNIKWI